MIYVRRVFLCLASVLTVNVSAVSRKEWARALDQLSPNDRVHDRYVPDELFQFVDVGSIHYTHGNPEEFQRTKEGGHREGGRLSIKWAGCEKYLYDSIRTILVGNGAIDGMFQRLIGVGATKFTVTSEQLTDALYATQLAIRESDEKWSLIPDVFFYEDNPRHEAFSNNNRSLYCLQAIQKYFGKGFEIAVKPMYARQMSQVHKLSDIHDCFDMTVNGRFPKKGNQQVKQLKKALFMLFPSTPQNPAERKLNLRGLVQHFDPANADLPEMESFTEFFRSKTNLRKRRARGKPSGRDAWRRRLVIALQ